MNQKSVWWNSEVKAVVRRKEFLEAGDEGKERYMEAYKD